MPLKTDHPAISRLRCLLFAVVCAALPAAGEPAAKTVAELRGGVLAVLEFNSKLVGDEKRAVDREYLAERVRKFAKELLPQATLIDRENVQVLLQAQGRDLADCEGECEVDTARRLGADLVISGDLLRFGSTLKLNLRLHEVASSKRLATEQASGKDGDELDRSIASAVAALLAPLSPAASPAAAAPPPVPEEHTRISERTPRSLVIEALGRPKAGETDAVARLAWAKRTARQLAAAQASRALGEEPYRLAPEAAQRALERAEEEYRILENGDVALTLRIGFTF